MKRLIVEHINSEQNVPVPSPLGQRNPALAGRVFKSASDEELVAQGKTDEVRLRWEDLTPEEVRFLAEECTPMKTTSAQVAIGVFYLEQGNAEKARKYLKYANSTAKTPEEKNEVARLMAEVEKSSPSPAPASSEPPPSAQKTKATSVQER